MTPTPGPMSDAAAPVDRTARLLLRTPLYDHQRGAVEALRNPSARRVVLLMPRQTGKTTLLWLDRMAYLFEPTTRRAHYQSCYAAQTGKVVTDRFSLPGGWINRIETSKLARTAKCTRTRGGEYISNRHTGSYFAALPATPGAARSASYDSAILDECQQHTHEYAQQLEGDLTPTQGTRPHAQIVYAGTANHVGSWWHEKVQAGRSGALLLYEVGTWPDDADPTDPAVWWTYHPGLRAGMTSEEFMRDELETLGPDTFAREYGNRFTKQAADTVFDYDAWLLLTADHPQPSRFYVGFDAAWDRAAGTAVASWTVGDTLHLEVIAHRPGTAWMADYLADLYQRRRPVLLADTATPARDVVRALQARRVPVTELSTGDYTAACAELLTATTEGTATHRPDPVLDLAVAAARRRPVGDRWVFDRRAAADISPLTAAAVAHWQARRPPAAPVLA